MLVGSVKCNMPLGYALSDALFLLALILVPLKGLNFGIDFRGSILMEIRPPVDARGLAAMRATSADLGFAKLSDIGVTTTFLFFALRMIQALCLRGEL
jgi:hypothetical protein